MASELSRAAPRGLGGTIQDWLHDFGRQESPELCPAIAEPSQVLQQQPQQGVGYWRFNGGPAVSTSQVNV